jgi:two-component system chemotaxis sensor kinase CheA
VDTARYSRLFQSEGRELVSRLNESLLALERDADPHGHVQALFRAMHTMKGMAAAMGLGSMAAVAHAAEEVLAKIREAGEVPSEAVVDALFATADWLDLALEAAADAGSEPDASAIFALFEDVAESGREAGSSGSSGSRQGHPSPSGGGERSHEATPAEMTGVPDVRAAPPSERAFTWRVRVRFSPDAQLAGVRAIMLLQRARTLGEVRDARPDESSLGDLQALRELSFVVTSAATERELEESLRSVGDVESVEVAVPASPDANGRAGAAFGEVSESGGDSHARDRGAVQSVVRVELRRLDRLMALTGELVIARGRLQARAAELGDGELEETASRIGRLVGYLQDEVLATRMVPAGIIFDRFPRYVRDAARKLGKDVDFTLDGRDIELDRALLEEIGEPLIHLLRNAVDHGLETRAEREAAGKPVRGRLTLAVERERDGVVIRVSDDGRGVDREAVLVRARSSGLVPPETAELSDDELLRVLAASGLSTRESVTELSGRGVGVDAVLSTASRLGGTVDLRTARGRGTTWSLRLPATLAIVRALLARVGNETYALPATHVRATADLADAGRATVRGREVVVIGEDVLPVVRLREVVGLPQAEPEHQDVVVLAAEDRRVGLLVDELLVQEEIVVKPFDAAREGARLFSGATVLPSGDPALIVDVGSLL